MAKNSDPAAVQTDSVSAFVPASTPNSLCVEAEPCVSSSKSPPSNAARWRQRRRVSSNATFGQTYGCSIMVGPLPAHHERDAAAITTRGIDFKEAKQACVSDHFPNDNIRLFTDSHHETGKTVLSSERVLLCVHT